MSVTPITSTLYFYKLPDEFNQTKNFIVDDLQDYLEDNESTLLTLQVDDFQYVKHNLNISIKVPLEQEDLAPINWTYGNFVAIENGQEGKHYYWITRYEWASASAIRLYLHEDVLNTYKNGVDFNISDKTQIHRQHKDRFTSITGHADWYKRKIDLYSEGLAPIKYKKELGDYKDTINMNWYLLYRNQNNIEPTDYNQVNPIDTFLIPEFSYQFTYNTTDKTLTYSDMENLTGTGLLANYVQISSNLNPNQKEITIEFDNISLKIYQNEYIQAGYRMADFYFITFNYNNGSNMRLRYKKIKARMNADGTIQSIIYPLEVLATYYITDLKLKLPSSNVYYGYDGTDSEFKNVSAGYITISQTTSVTTPKCIEDIDLTDSKIIKLIKLPYCPVECSLVNNVISFGDSYSFEVDSSYNAIKILDTRIKFENKVINKNSYIYDDFFEHIQPNIHYKDSRYIKDSKLFHSDFMQYKFVYDSFGKFIDFEKVDEATLPFDWGDYSSKPFDVKFYMTKTINSRFLFSFPEYVLKHSVEDYDNYLYVNRNNEMTLYSNQYLNYLRTGYNYDVKNKERQQVAGAVTTTGAVVGAVGSVATGFAMGNVAGAVVGAVVGVIGIASTLINAVNSYAQSEASINQKMSQYQSQATSVFGADDVDLLEVYSGNRAKLCKYEISKRMEDLMSDLFHYCGYSCNEIGVPDTTSRKWFNFVQCDLKVDYDTKLNDDELQELITKYGDGVTYIHHVDYTGDLGEDIVEYDFEQKYENYEEALF